MDGSTINEPYWSSRGSPNPEDTYELDFGAPAKRFDTVKLYFYRDRTADGLAEPAKHRLQYQNGNRWVDVPRQNKSPAIPRANYNEVRFPDVTARRLRVVLTHQAGHRTGLKEFEVFHTGEFAQRPANVTPYVLAKQDLAFHRAARARLIGVVKDDALPDNTLTFSWSQVDGPGTAIFADPSAASTVATFTKPGDYTLRLTATDGAATSSSVVTVTATPIPDVINVSPDAAPWASSTSPWESVGAIINDGIDPPVSNDGVNRRWGTWPNEGEQWVQLDWANPVRVNANTTAPHSAASRPPGCGPCCRAGSPRSACWSGSSTPSRSRPSNRFMWTLRSARCPHYPPPRRRSTPTGRGWPLRSSGSRSSRTTGTLTRIGIVDGTPLPATATIAVLP